MKNNSEVLSSLYYAQGYISLLLVTLILGYLIYHMLKSYDFKNERIKHKVNVEIEKKLYY